MKYAENNRISGRQLYRQIVLSFLAPFLLCLPDGKFMGIPGIAAVIAAAPFLCLYVFVLLRAAPGCSSLVRALGGFGGRLTGAFFLIYILFTGTFLLRLLEEVVPVWLTEGISGWILALAAVLACSYGSSGGMQRRGRMAEVFGGLVLLGMALMLVLCAGQIKTGYAGDFGKSGFTAGGTASGCYRLLCGFSGLGLLPFVLKDVEKRGRSGRMIVLSILTLCGILVAIVVILPMTLGLTRVQNETFPVMPLLAGADLSGNVLARFDVLWMGFLLFSLFFALGSLFHYGNQVAARAGLGNSRYWLPAAVFFFSILFPEIRDWYEDYLGRIFVPGLLLIHMILMTAGNRKRGRKISAAASLTAIILFLNGCAGTEPEKRLYPLALGVEKTEEGFRLSYGMADLPEATGQDKEEETPVSVLSVAGTDFMEIEEIYTRSQEKFLDMGHLQAVLIGEEMLADGSWQEFLQYLKQEPLVGENVYVFYAEEPEEILKWDSGGSSVGEYLTRLMENQTGQIQKKGVTLRQVYERWYDKGEMPALPQVVKNGSGIQVTGI